MRLSKQCVSLRLLFGPPSSPSLSGGTAKRERKEESVCSGKAHRACGRGAETRNPSGKTVVQATQKEASQRHFTGHRGSTAFRVQRTGFGASLCVLGLFPRLCGEHSKSFLNDVGESKQVRNRHVRNDCDTVQSDLYVQEASPLPPCCDISHLESCLHLSVLSPFQIAFQVIHAPLLGTEFPVSTMWGTGSQKQFQ